MRFVALIWLTFVAICLSQDATDDEDEDMDDTTYDDMIKQVNGTIDGALELIDGLKTDPKNKRRYHRRMHALKSHATKVRKNKHYENVRDASTDVASSLDDIFSGEPDRMLKGFVKSAASLTTFIPDPAGSLIGGMVSIGLSWLGLADEEPSMEEVMGKMLDKKFKALYKRLDEKFAELYKVLDEKFKELNERLDVKFDEMAARIRAMQIQTLKQEFEGASITIQGMHRNMQGMMFSEKTINEQDLDYLSSQVTSTAGLRVMGMLKVLIMDLVEETDFSGYDSTAEDRFHNQATEIYALIKLYAYLSTIRKLMLVMARGIYIEAEITNTAQDGLNLMISDLDAYDKSWLSFLSNPETEGQQYVVASYEPNDEILRLYFKHLGVDPFAGNKFAAAKGICNEVYVPKKNIATTKFKWQLASCNGGTKPGYETACGLISRAGKCGPGTSQATRFRVQTVEEGDDMGKAYLQTECRGIWQDVKWPLDSNTDNPKRLAVGETQKNDPAYFTFMKVAGFSEQLYAVRKGVGADHLSRRHCFRPGASDELPLFGQLTSCNDGVYEISYLDFENCEN